MLGGWCRSCSRSSARRAEPRRGPRARKTSAIIARSLVDPPSRVTSRPIRRCAGMRRARRCHRRVVIAGSIFLDRSAAWYSSLMPAPLPSVLIRGMKSSTRFALSCVRHAAPSVTPAPTCRFAQGQSQLSGCKFEQTRHQSIAQLAPNHHRAHGQRRPARADRLRRAAALCRQGRALPHEGTGHRRRATSCSSRARNRISAERHGVQHARRGPARSTTRPARRSSRQGAPQQSAGDAGARTRSSGAKSCTSSGRGNTGSCAAASPPACSRRRAGKSRPARSTLNLDDYALLKNAVFKVKGVPLLYLPVFYYPMEEDDRSTGFLMPTYGTRDARGADDQQRVLLGDRPQPRRHVRARLVHEDRPGMGAALPVCAARRARRATRASTG